MTIPLRSRRNVPPINIGVFEGFQRGDEDAIIMNSPGWSRTSSSPGHANTVVKIMRRYLPDPEKHRIHLMPPTISSIKYCIDNDIKIVNMSLAGSRMPENREKELAEHAFLITSAGNSGSDGETTAARREHWMAVGAVDRNYRLHNYSSWGLGHVKAVAQPELGNGTSFAAPVVAALLGQWYAWYYEATGVYPNVKQTNNFIRINCHDILADGKDLQTGWGLFRLPWMYEASKVVLTNDSTAAKKYTYTQEMNRSTQTKEESITLNVAPKIENNRTLVGSRDSAELFGLNVNWDRSRPQESVYVR